MVDFYPLLLCFTSCISTPWIFACNVFSALYDLENRLRDPLRSWGLFSFMTSSTFSEGVPNWSGTLQRILSLLKFSRRMLRFSFLLSRLAFFFGLLLVPKGPLFSWVSEIIGGTALRLRSMSWGVLSLTYCIVVQWQKKYLGIYSLQYFRSTLVAVFNLHSVDEEIIK